MSDLTLDVGLAAKLKVAFARNGWTANQIDKICEGNTLNQFRQVLEGYAEIKAVEYLIDCDANPFIPDGWSVVEHQKTGAFKWDPKKVRFYLSKEQRKKDGRIEGNKLREELRSKFVLNANVLDYLLEHPHLIPEEWKRDEQRDTRYIFFWGTIYRDANNLLYVRCLYGRGGAWRWRAPWLGCMWSGGGPAALLAVPTGRQAN